MESEVRYVADVQWIKIFVNMFDTSRKIKRIEKMKNGDTFLVLWFKLLCMAGAINDGGAIYVTKNVPYELEDLADELRKKADIVKSALDTFEEYEMIYKDHAGFIVIKNWEKYQNVEGLEKIREQTRVRVAKCRANKNNATVTQCNATSNATVTQCNAIEEEREEDKEKENSFSHSCAREEKYIENKVAESELTEKDAEIYRQEVKEGLRRKYIGGKLGKGVVFMSDAQFESLFDFLSIDEIEKYFAIIIECETNGKRYKKKTHYQAILDMAMKDRKIK